MIQDTLLPRPWLNNTLLDEGFIQRKARELAAAPVAYGLEAWLDKHFDAAILASCSEAQLEDKFIGPMLAQLGWTKVTQTTITVQGKLAKPDWCLLLEPAQEKALIATKDHTLITAC